VDHGDAGPRRDVGPHLAAAPRASPGQARLLAGDRNETEISDRRAAGGGIALDHDDRKTGPPRPVRMGDADDAATDDRAIEGSLVHVQPACRPGGAWHATATRRCH
jgi:hypothetical protein